MVAKLPSPLKSTRFLPLTSGKTRFPSTDARKLSKLSIDSKLINSFTAPETLTLLFARVTAIGNSGTILFTPIPAAFAFADNIPRFKLPLTATLPRFTFKFKSKSPRIPLASKLSKSTNSFTTPESLTLLFANVTAVGNSGKILFKPIPAALAFANNLPRLKLPLIATLP